MMDYNSKKSNRYLRIIGQLAKLLPETDDRIARMSTVIALLHHKMDGFFWTGCYFLKDDKLVAGPYQGPVACQELTGGNGVCWTAVKKNQTIVVEDVEAFPGHIACDPRSKSEIVVPLRDPSGDIIGVLDVDSKNRGNFDTVDARELEKITKMIFT